MNIYDLLNNGNGNNLSKRIDHLLERDEEFLCKCLHKCQDDPWSLTQSNGYINLGTAESSLCHDILLEKINQNNFFKADSSMLRYFKFHGTQSCRKTISKFVEKYFKPSEVIDPENLIILSGSTAVFDLLAHTIADPGEYFMCATPYYSRIKDDIYERSLVRTIHVPMEMEEVDGKLSARINVHWFEESYAKSVSLTMENKCFLMLVDFWTYSTYPLQCPVGDYQTVYKSVRSERHKGKTIRAIIVVNPNNPLGIVHSEEDLLSLVEFATREGQEKFRSILSLNSFSHKSKLIWLWGLSKDFCNAGFRFSVFYSHDQNVLTVAKTICFSGCVPPVIQHLTEKLLSDYKWLDNVYFPQNRGALKKNCDIVEKWLNKFRIPYCIPNSGMFIFVNFSGFLHSITETAEMELFEKFMEARVFIVPGCVLHAHAPGWYRITFPVESIAVQEGLRRIENVLVSQRNNVLHHGVGSFGVLVTRKSSDRRIRC